MPKKVLSKYQMITSGDMSATSITSRTVPIEFLSCVGIQLNWTGTPVGTVAVNVSVDYEQDNFGNVINAGNWVALTLSTPVAPSGAAGTAYINLGPIAAPYIQVVYTKTSSTGTLNAFACGKETS